MRLTGRPPLPVRYELACKTGAIEGRSIILLDRDGADFDSYDADSAEGGGDGPRIDASGFIARSWTAHSPMGPFHQRSFEMHEEVSTSTWGTLKDTCLP